MKLNMLCYFMLRIKRRIVYNISINAVFNVTHVYLMNTIIYTKGTGISIHCARGIQAAAVLK